MRDKRTKNGTSWLRERKILNFSGVAENSSDLSERKKARQRIKLA